jgi:hypothetical protein
MKRSLVNLILMLITLACLTTGVSSQTGAITFRGKLTDATTAQPTAFTYQGKLTDGGVPANGTYEFQFTLYDEASMNLGSATGSLTVTSGIFTASIDGASALFTSSNPPRFLEIGVKLPGGGPYTTLTPRQPITSSPYAIKSANSDSAEYVSGIVSPLHGGTGIGGNTYPPEGQFLRTNGAGWSATGLSAKDIPTTITVQAVNIIGVVPVAKGGTGSSTQNFVDLTTNQAVGGNKNFSGVVSGNGSGLTNLNGANLNAGSVNATQMGALSITSTALGDGAVLTNKIADGAVTHTKLAGDFKNGFDPQKVAMMRWDQIPTIPKAVDVGRSPSALAFDGTFMYVANNLDNNVMRIRTSTGLIEGDPIVVGNAPSALVYDGFRSVWSANYADGTLSRISIQNAVVDMTVSGVGTNPCALAFDGTLIYVADCAGDKVRRVTKTGSVVGQTTVGHKSVGLVFDGTFVYVAEPFNQGTGVDGSVRRIRASSGAVEGTISNLFGGPLAFDGTFVYIANSTAIPRIRASTFALEPIYISTTNSGMNVSSNNFAICFDGTSVYISGLTTGNGGGPKVIKANVSGLGIEGLTPAQGDGVYALAFDGAYIYAAVRRSNVSVPVNGYVIRFQ